MRCSAFVFANCALMPGVSGPPQVHKCLWIPPGKSQVDSRITNNGNKHWLARTWYAGKFQLNHQRSFLPPTISMGIQNMIVVSFQIPTATCHRMSQMADASREMAAEGDITCLEYHDVHRYSCGLNLVSPLLP